MDKKEYLEKKNKPPRYPNGYAGAICGKCGEGFIGEHEVLDPLISSRFLNKYGTLCGKCCQQLNLKYVQ